MTDTQRQLLIPTKSKDAQFRVCAELVRFIAWLGHRKVYVRCDDEKPVQSTLRACRHLGIKARSESTPGEEHAVEEAWNKSESVLESVCERWRTGWSRRQCYLLELSILCTHGACFIPAGYIIGFRSTCFDPS